MAAINKASKNKVIKISIGSNIINGPWGGGNQFVISLAHYLNSKGWKVVSNLNDRDIDIILLTEPRITSESGRYNQLQISKYIIMKPDTIVIHRINECDERKETKYLNKYLMRANKVADYTVFISNFLKNLFIEKKFFHGLNCTVIKNGADSRIFNAIEKEKWNGKSPVRIVTHHWGYNYLKGFDIYKKIDSLKSIKGKRIEFSYIGRLPSNNYFDNCKIIPPLSGKELTDELKKNHIYVTGSINEPAGMHHIEGAMCGLPLLYRNSGALPEYCNGFGVMFNGVEDFEEKLIEVINSYSRYLKRLKRYPYNAELMNEQYEKLFFKLIKTKGKMNHRKRRFVYLMIYIKEVILHVRDKVLVKIKRILRYFG